MSEQKAEPGKNFLPQGKYLKPEEIEYEFGGTIGVLGMLIGFPLLTWYMWISAEFYGGKFALPENGESLATVRSSPFPIVSSIMGAHHIRLD